VKGSALFNAPPHHPSSRHSTPRSRRVSAASSSEDCPTQSTAHFVRRVQQPPSQEQPPRHVNRPLNKAPVAERALPTSRHSAPAGPVPARTFQQGAAYYSDGGDDWAEPSHVAVDDRRKRAGLRARDHPLCVDRTEGRARFEYDLAHMSEEGRIRDRRHYSASPSKMGAQRNGKVFGGDRFVYQGQLLPTPETRGMNLCAKEERLGAVEWWRLPPIAAPVDGARPHGLPLS
jgi:hypothetical protein